MVNIGRCMKNYCLKCVKNAPKSTNVCPFPFSLEYNAPLFFGELVITARILVVARKFSLILRCHIKFLTIF